MPISVRMIDRLASWPIAVASGALLAAFAVVLFTSNAPFSIPHVEDACGAAPLDVRFHTTGQGVEQFLSGCGEAGREAYRNLQIADLFYPAVVGIFMTSTLALVFKQLFPQRPGAGRLAGLGLAASSFDYLENLLAWRALGAFPGSASTNSLLGFASAAKTSTSWLAGIILLVAVVALTAKLVRRRVALGVSVVT